MNLVCCGMYRSCSTWQYLVARRLIQLSGEVQDSGFETWDGLADLLGTPSAGGWRIVKAHEGSRHLHKAIRRGDTIALYSYRDIRDVACSLSHLFGISVEDLVSCGMVDQVLQNDRFWREQPATLLQRYDDLIADPVTGVLQIAKHLRLTVTEDVAKGIAQEFSIDENRKRTASIAESTAKATEEELKAMQWDNNTLMHWNHIRKGQAGGWHRELTSSQGRLLDAMAGKWLIEQGFETNRDWVMQLGVTDLTLPQVAHHFQLRSIGKIAFQLRAIYWNYPHQVKALKTAINSTFVGRQLWAFLRSMTNVSIQVVRSSKNAIQRPKGAGAESPQLAASRRAA